MALYIGIVTSTVVRRILEGHAKLGLDRRHGGLLSDHGEVQGVIARLRHRHRIRSPSGCGGRWRQ
jgi:hypothetical protein